MNEPSKKQLIIDAANKILEQNDTRIVIRLATGEDKPIEIKSNEEKASKKKSEPELEIKEVKESDNLIEKQEDAKQKIDRIESDQERMVIQLFDGKYVE